MTTEIKRQKLQAYIENASDEEVEFMYNEVMDDEKQIEWSDEFTAEMERRVQEIENGSVKTVSLDQALENALHAIQKVRNSAAISH